MKAIPEMCIAWPLNYISQYRSCSFYFRLVCCISLYRKENPPEYRYILGTTSFKRYNNWKKSVSMTIYDSLKSSVNHQLLTNIKVVSMCIQPWRRNIKTGLGIRVLLAQLWRGYIKAGLGIHVVLVQPCCIKVASMI